jgi:hypothetical protein
MGGTFAKICEEEKILAKMVAKLPDLTVGGWAGLYCLALGCEGQRLPTMTS